MWDWSFVASISPSGSVSYSKLAKYIFIVFYVASLVGEMEDENLGLIRIHNFMDGDYCGWKSILLVSS